MKNVMEWQRALKEAADQRFPESGWDVGERIASVYRQLDDVIVALTVEKGEAKSSHLAHRDLNHSIGALIADALILAEKRGVDTEAELEKVLAWFKDPTPKS
jgi:hypothetical protein